MTRLGHAFVDCVSGDDVHYWRDKFGNEWMAKGPWSLFRVARIHHGELY